MEIRPAKDVLKEIEETRQQIGSLVMVLDGAQVHFMIESMVESLKVVSELLILSKNIDPSDWPTSQYGSQEDTLKSARELGFTAISTIKMFMDALPDNLKDFDKKITPDKLNLIESFFREN